MYFSMALLPIQQAPLAIDKGCGLQVRSCLCSRAVHGIKGHPLGEAIAHSLAVMPVDASSIAQTYKFIRLILHY